MCYTKLVQFFTLWELRQRESLRQKVQLFAR